MNKIKIIEEDFLHYVWRYRLFSSSILKSCKGELIQIVDPGQYNKLGGPDFLHASIRIGSEIWNGHVEIHVRASDWLRHGHEQDPHYKNVILHVVLIADQDISLYQEGDLQVVEIQQYLLPGQYDKYRHWKDGRSKIPCERHLRETDAMMWFSWKERLLIERLENRSTAILEELNRCNYDWNESFYRYLLRAFGMKWNGDAMYSLACSLPLTIIQRNAGQLEKAEALLFGQAGMLNEIFSDDYPTKLQREYHFLQQKYNLTPISAVNWQFGRIRPVNFPSLRIAQLARLLSEQKFTFQNILEQREIEPIREAMRVGASDYWCSHFRFDTRVSAGRTVAKNPGDDLINTALINTIIPFLFTYGKTRHQDHLSERALEWLMTCPAENNQITREWLSHGITIDNAWDSQAMIQLYNVYCTSFSCLQCMAGHDILKNR